MANAYKHAAMALRPTAETLEKCRTITQTDNRDTITQTDNRDTITHTLKLSNAIYRAGNYLVFKSDIPNTVDVFEMRSDKKLRPVASFMRDKEEYALNAAKNFLLTKV